MAKSASRRIALGRFHVASASGLVVSASGFVALVSGFVAFMSLFAAPCDVHSAEVTLLDGRVWEGVIVRETKDMVVLETVGGEIEISRRAITNIDRSPTRRQIYDARLNEMDKEDADQHYLLGLWCRRNRLLREGDYHLNYAIALDVDHEGARRALGHVKYQDKWMPEKDAKEAQGLRFYGGRWMTKEAAEQAEADDLKREMSSELERQVRTLAEIIASPRTEQAARNAVQQLFSFHDPLAFDAIASLLRHRDEKVREVAIRVVDRLKVPGTDVEILAHALYDTDANVRDRARKSVKDRWNPTLLPETLKALRSDDEFTLRFNAALVLGLVKETDAIDPLIEAIYVQYRFKGSDEPGPPSLGISGYVVRDVHPLDARGPVIVDPVAGVVGAGPGVAWKPIDAPADDRFAYVINYAALDALRAITAQDFGVNKRAWRTWWDENRDNFRAWKEVK